MKSVLDVRALCTEYLSKKGIPNPKLDADHLIASVLGITRMELYLDLERPLAESELDACRTLLQRRGDREPLQYLLKTVPFHDCTIEVTPAVLIPRPETEQLVELVIGKLKSEDLHGKKLLDLCTGSGCIAIAMKKAFPKLGVIASDLSSEALEVAQRNAVRNELEIEFIQSDLFSGLEGQTFDFVVSNPPYVSEKEYQELKPELKQEPKMALVSGEEGLEVYRQIAKDVKDCMTQNGKLWLEIGSQQGESLLSLFNRGEILKDWSGNDRFFSFIK